MRNLLLAFFLVLAAPPVWAQELAPALNSFSGSLKAGETFSHPLPDNMVFMLKPSDKGWQIMVKEQTPTCIRDCVDDACYNTARITLPLHGVNATDIEGWHFRNADNTAANDGSVNAPTIERDFTYALRCADDVAIMDSYMCTMSGDRNCADITQLKVGQGTLTIGSYQLTPFAKGQQAAITSMSFTVSTVTKTLN